jgi:hypothetical protein
MRPAVRHPGRRRRSRTDTSKARTPKPSERGVNEVFRVKSATAGANLSAEASLHPRAVTIAVMPGPLPECTVCKGDGVERLARYDSGYTARTDGPWTYLCVQHFDELGPGRVGNGIGQYLITWWRSVPRYEMHFCARASTGADVAFPGRIFCLGTSELSDCLRSA